MQLQMSRCRRGPKHWNFRGTVIWCVKVKHRRFWRCHISHPRRRTLNLMPPPVRLPGIPEKPWMWSYRVPSAGEPVRVIGYHAFDAAKDYTDTVTSSNQTEWVHIRSIVIPDTVRTIEDNALSYLQQLELFVCYAPLETTGGTQFMLCRSLKNVIFVNPLKALGNYLFESCDALELVWYPNTLDSVGIQCFSQSMIDALVIDAKAINYFAFARCDNLKEIHLRGSLESLDVSAFAEVPLERLCLETTNPDGITEGFFGEPLESLMVIVPESTTDEELDNFVRMLGPAGKGMIQNQDQIVRGACTQPDPIPRPDVDALLSAYGIHQG